MVRQVIPPALTSKIFGKYIEKKYKKKKNPQKCSKQTEGGYQKLRKNTVVGSLGFLYDRISQIQR